MREQQVRQDRNFPPGPWPAEHTGVVTGVAPGPDTVEGLGGALDTYWMRFDEPQFDADDDGPYADSQVLAEYLELLPEC